MWEFFKEVIHLRRDIQDLAAIPEQGLDEGEDVPGTTGGLIGSGVTMAFPGWPSGGGLGELLAWHRWHTGDTEDIDHDRQVVPGDDVFVVANVGGTSKTETFTFPAEGDWRVRLKTNDPRYGYVPENSQDPEDVENVPPVGGSVSAGPDLGVTLTLPQYTAVVFSMDCPDSDGDGICDYKDNCNEVATRFVDDSDGDGYGNACDPDFDNTGSVGQSDYERLISHWGQALGDPEYDALVDLDGNGGIGVSDYGIFLSYWEQAPGPSGLSCAGSGELCTGPESGPSDNCSEVPNPDQRDTNQDGYGNLCDADFDNNGVVGGSDYILMSIAYGSSLNDPEDPDDDDANYDPDIDMDGDGSIGAADWDLFLPYWGAAPGPSGLSCAGTIPCP
jgi:hypothetical protein